jgi:hypothetical protein
VLIAAFRDSLDMNEMEGREEREARRRETAAPTKTLQNKKRIKNSHLSRQLIQPGDNGSTTCGEGELIDKEADQIGYLRRADNLVVCLKADERSKPPRLSESIGLIIQFRFLHNLVTRQCWRLHRKRVCGS